MTQKRMTGGGNNVKDIKVKAVNSYIEMHDETVNFSEMQPRKS